ncbi:DUF2304 family protein [Syntrophomonas wolfei]|jgi:hypothetical protein|uniref:DUF2304 family protein n=1 Tax=Syntrophomonas wolfei TaxID=863 RepID=UPI0007737D50|nr:DUF2304 family protein [Syntrophomonas wolfei]
MNNNQFYIPIIASLIFIIINIELIKREKLKESYGVFWIVISIGMLVVALNIKSFYIMGAFLKAGNIAWGYALATFMLFLLGLFFSVKMSLYAKHIKNLNQQVAILTLKIEEIINQSK